jgi:hypothetical protein
MRTEEDNIVVIVAAVRDKTKLQKILGNTEVIWEFAEKLGDRYEIRLKLDKTLWNYLTEIEVVLPILDKIKFSELYMNLMKILGFIHLYFYIYSIISNNHIILICIIDSMVDYDLKRNAEIEKCDGNVVNGTLGLKRDANLQSLELFHSYEDVREVSFG